MTLRLFLVLLNGTLAISCFLAALLTRNVEKKQTRLLYAIYFTCLEITQILGAIAIHTGAYPLWNNR